LAGAGLGAGYAALEGQDVGKGALIGGGLGAGLGAGVGLLARRFGTQAAKAPDVAPTAAVPEQPITPTATKNTSGAFTQFRIFKKINTGVWSQLGSNVTAITTSAGPVLPDQFGFADQNNPNYTYTATAAYSDTYNMPTPSSGTSSTVQYKVDGNYSVGVPNKDSRGNSDTRTPQIRNNPQPGPQAASTGFESSVQTITGMYPYFWGSSTTAVSAAQVAAAIQSGTANKVLASADGTLSINFNVDSKYIWFAHYDLYPLKKSWNTSLVSTPAAIANGDPTSIWNSPTTQNVTSPNAYWSNVPFKIYTGNIQQTSANGVIWNLRNESV
jgi:hypothetical protein